MPLNDSHITIFKSAVDSFERSLQTKCALTTKESWNARQLLYTESLSLKEKVRSILTLQPWSSTMLMHKSGELMINANRLLSRYNNIVENWVEMKWNLLR